MKKKLKIIIADDHPVFLHGVFHILSQRDDIEITGQASNGRAALELIRKEKPDIVILDVEMPEMDGFEAAKIVRAEFPEIKVIMLTMFIDEALIKKVMGLGIKGYILKESAVIDILKCIDAVNSGRFYLSPQVSDLLMEINIKDKAPGKEDLTKTEKRILELIALGKSSREIAQELSVTEKTVENHRSNICKKLGITGNSALLKYALKSAVTR